MFKAGEAHPDHSEDVKPPQTLQRNQAVAVARKTRVRFSTANMSNYSSNITGNSSSKLPKYGDTDYWSYQPRPAGARDLGHTCRECKRPITRMNEAIVERRGGRIQMRYHEKCFSNEADPRSQASAAHGKWAKQLKNAEAPKQRYSKMRTSSHW